MSLINRDTEKYPSDLTYNKFTIVKFLGYFREPCSSDEQQVYPQSIIGKAKNHGVHLVRASRYTVKDATCRECMKMSIQSSSFITVIQY